MPGCDIGWGLNIGRAAAWASRRHGKRQGWGLHIDPHFVWFHCIMTSSFGEIRILSPDRRGGGYT